MSRNLKELRDRYTREKERLEQLQLDFDAKKSRSSGSRGLREEFETELNDLREEIRRESSKLKKQEKNLESDKLEIEQRRNKLINQRDRAEERLHKLRESIDKLTEEAERRQDELDDLNSSNKELEERLAEARVERDRLTAKLELLRGDIEKERHKDKDLFPLSSLRNISQKERELVERAKRKSREVREMILDRFHLRNQIRELKKDNLEIEEKIDVVGREIDSIKDQEDEICKLSEHFLRGLENSSLAEVLEGTKDHRDFNRLTKQEQLERYSTSTEHLEQLVQNVPQFFQRKAYQNGACAVNPKYRGLITSLLQKIGLLMIQENHQQLRLLGVPFNYADHLINWRSKNRQLRHKLEQIEGDKLNEINTIKEQIQEHHEERERLKQDRDDMHELFEKYKNQRPKLEQDIRDEKEDLKRHQEVVEDNERLKQTIRDLKRKLDETNKKMNERSSKVQEGNRDLGRLGRDSPESKLNFRVNKDFREDDSDSLNDDADDLDRGDLFGGTFVGDR